MIIKKDNFLYNGDNAKFHSFGIFNHPVANQKAKVVVLSYIDMMALRVGGLADATRDFYFDYDPKSGELMQDQARDQLLLTDEWADGELIEP